MPFDAIQYVREHSIKINLYDVADDIEEMEEQTEDSILLLTAGVVFRDLAATLPSLCNPLDISRQQIEETYSFQVHVDASPDEREALLRVVIDAIAHETASEITICLLGVPSVLRTEVDEEFDGRVSASIEALTQQLRAFLLVHIGCSDCPSDLHTDASAED